MSTKAAQVIDLASLEPLFRPRSVAIVGASTDPTKISGRPIRNLLANGYPGRILPVNPKARMIQGLPAYPSLAAVDGEIDLAILAMAGPLVEEGLDQCIEKGVKSLIVYSAGFAEVDDGRRSSQHALAAKARAARIRMLGPNCMGVVNFTWRLSASFLPAFAEGVVPGGRMGLVSQSGAFGSLSFVMAKERGTSFSCIVSTGNEADVDVADCMAFLANDPETRVIMLYLEGARDGPKLIEAMEVARRNEKPVVAIKLGRTAAGAKAAESHTAALVGTDEVYDAVFRQCGVYRASSIEEFFDVGCTAAMGQLPCDNNVGLITISGGVGVLMADDAVQRGLNVSCLSDRAQAEIRQLVPFAAVNNPVDVTGQVFADMGLFCRSVEVVLREGKYGSIVAFQGSAGTDPEHERVLREAWIRLQHEHPDVLITVSGILTREFRQDLERSGIPTFGEATHATRAIGALAAFRRSLSEPWLRPDVPSVEDVLRAGPLNEVETMAVLRRAGIPTIEGRLVHSADDAVRVFREFGKPVVVKIVSAQITHKSDIGGVVLNVGDEQQVRTAFRTIMENGAKRYPEARIDGCLVAPMAGPGIETILGIQRDPTFGPVVMLGLGGTFVEVWRDVTFRVAPFDVSEAKRMIGELRGTAILRGVRGQPPADVEALAEAVSRLSVFAAQSAQRIESLDINPFLVRPRGEGAVALDALLVARQ